MLIEEIQKYLDGLNSKNNDNVTKVVLDYPPSEDDSLETLAQLKLALIKRLTGLKADGYADHKVNHLELVDFTITCAELYKLTQTNIQLLSLKNCKIVLGKEPACMPREATTLTLLDLENTQGGGLSTSFLTFLLLNCPKLATVNFAFTKINPTILNHFYYRKAAVANLDIRGVSIIDLECLIKILVKMKELANIKSSLNIDNQQAEKLLSHSLHNYNFADSKPHKSNSFLQHIVTEQYNLTLLIDSCALKKHKKKDKSASSVYKVEPLNLGNVLAFQHESFFTKNSVSAPARLLNKDSPLLPLNNDSMKSSLKKNKSHPSIYNESSTDHIIQIYPEPASLSKPFLENKQNFYLDKKTSPQKIAKVSEKNNTTEKPNVFSEQCHQTTSTPHKKLTSNKRQII